MADFELKVEVREIPIGLLSEKTGQIPDYNPIVKIPIRGV